MNAIQRNLWTNSRTIFATANLNFHPPNRYSKYASSVKSRVEINKINLIKEHTVITTRHSTPELKLRLITNMCGQWYAGEKELVFEDPFWAFYWPGGQALTRYILDSGVCAGKSVLDVGCGCGASAIAGVLTGAVRVVANDIDTVALTATLLNAELNGASLEVNSQDLIGIRIDSEVISQNFRIDSDPTTGTGRPIVQQKVETDNSTPVQQKFEKDFNEFLQQKFEKEHKNFWDIILVGDMFYDGIITNRILKWLENLKNPRRRILLGDPGRPYFDDNIKVKFKKIAEYELSEESRSENNGLTVAGVYEYNG